MRIASGMVALAIGLVAATVSADTTAPPPPRTYELADNALKLPGPVVYVTGKPQLLPESDAVLAYVKGYLEAKPDLTLLRVEVHTDSMGADEWNQRLSAERSLAVVRWLVGHGVDCKRLLPVGFGETKPIADNRTEEGRRQNRRTLFVNAALRGRPIGGMPVDGGGKIAGDACLR